MILADNKKITVKSVVMFLKKTFLIIWAYILVYKVSNLTVVCVHLKTEVREA